MRRRRASRRCTPGAAQRGYASALVAAVARTLLDRGKTVVYLTADLSNATSNAIYQRLGFREVGDQYHFDLVNPRETRWRKPG
jgi:predicted GNAT family acetyltransferase